MKCISCKKDFQGSGIVCSNCRSIENFLEYIGAHVCLSFSQARNAPKGQCEYCLSCTPIKMALKKKSLFQRDGHVICPHPTENLRHVIYGLTMDEIQKYFPECIE